MERGLYARTAIGHQPGGRFRLVTGLLPLTPYDFRVSATNSGGTSTGENEMFKTLLSPPTVVTKAASSVAQTTASLNASVNPNGGEVSKCEFEYGETTSYGKTASVRLAARVGDEPSRSHRLAYGAHSEHHLPLQNLSDKRGRNQPGL